MPLCLFLHNLICPLVLKLRGKPNANNSHCNCVNSQPTTTRLSIVTSFSPARARTSENYGSYDGDKNYCINCQIHRK